MSASSIGEIVRDASRVVGSVVTKVEQRGEYIRWTFVNDAGLEQYYEWHASLRTVPIEQLPADWQDAERARRG